ncbi:MAG: hypothetical protein WC939_02125 [Acholeplasmataceae bacterium]
MKNKTFEMVLFATFSAIILVLSLIPNIGFLTFLPGMSITIVHIPVLIGIMLLSFYYALGLGFVFGIGSLIASYLYASNIGDLAFQNPLVSVLPRLIFAAVAFLIIYLLKKIQTTKHGILINFIVITVVSVLFIVIGIIGLHLNTTWHLALIISIGVLFLVLLMGGYTYFLFKSKNKHLAYVPSSMLSATLVHSFLVLTMIAIVKPQAFGDGDIFYIILTTITTNSIIEALVAVLVGSPIVFALYSLRSGLDVTV